MRFIDSKKKGDQKVTERRYFFL